MDTESPETWIEREKMEQILINKGGLRPHPWKVEEGDYHVIRIVARDGSEVAQVSGGKLVANWIKEQFNKNPVAFLEDDIYYY